MEKRQFPRKRSFLRAKALFNHGQSTFDCTVRNLSPGGMKLAISEAIVLPDVFELHLPQKSETHRVRLKWRRADEAGVALIGTLLRAPPCDVSEKDARILQLETEVARLESLVVYLVQKRNRLLAAFKKHCPSAELIDDDEFTPGDPHVDVKETTFDVLDDQTFEWVQKRRHS